MSRKHFKALAEAISKLSDQKERSHMAHLIGEVCAENNDRFQWSKWLKACNATD